MQCLYMRSRIFICKQPYIYFGNSQSWFLLILAGVSPKFWHHSYLQYLLLAGTCALKVQDINITKILLCALFQRIWDTKRNFDFLLAVSMWLERASFECEKWTCCLVYKKHTNYNSFMTFSLLLCKKWNSPSNSVLNHCLNLKIGLQNVTNNLPVKILKMQSK